MGMSASQARLIALTARMNDIEYQGQQINQQRTTLSNQTNSYNTQLLEMNVPTPPSTSDYTKIQYNGTLDASNFTLSNVVPTGQNDMGKNTYTIDFGYSRSGSSVSKSNSSTILTKTTPTLGYSKSGAEEKFKWILSQESTFKPDAQLKNLPSNDDQDVLLAVDVEEYKKWPNKFMAQGVYDASGNSIENLDGKTGTIYVKCNVADLKTEEFGAIVKTTKGTDDTISSYDNLYSLTEGSKTSYGVDYKDDYDISDWNLYYIKDIGSDTEVPTQIKTWGELKSYLGTSFDTSHIFTQSSNADDAVQYKNGDYDASNTTGYSVETKDGTKTVYQLNDEKAIEELGGSYGSYIEALRNAFPSEFGSSATDAEIASNFYVYITKSASGTIEPHFIRHEDLTKFDGQTAAVTPYEYDEDGTYTVTEAKKECQLEFDVSSGRITKVGIPNDKGQVTWVDVKSETITDQNAYQDAMNNYEYEKAKYDKAQQDINAKISIVQQQDKSLELKLTRLDNERNAVNTEIDAVKKVVQDNIEKSYKTFSG